MKFLLLQHVNMSQGLEMQILLSYKAAGIAFLILPYFPIEVFRWKCKRSAKIMLNNKMQGTGLSLTALGPPSSSGDMFVCFTDL